MTRALVLGGGGVTGIAWEIGVLCGLHRAGVRLGEADTIIGTSAGSVVGTLLASGGDLEMAAAQQEKDVPAGRSSSSGGPGNSQVLAALAVLADPSIPPQEARARVGAMALAAPTRDEQTYVAMIGAGLPVQDWPDRDLRVTAVDTADGRDLVFDAASGVPLWSAVAASCAVPGIFPPVTIDGRRYMDGGIRVGAAADLAAGADHLVVIAPMAALTRARITAEIAASGAGRSLLIEPDTAALQEMGQNMMDPAHRAASVRAGIRQGQALAEDVRAVWL
ncbi:patatin-like phospholipase family protein [Actinoplanes sp. NEAU-A12]|uniref:Patatin-like phospholipase family protein n=1 Tax=Actinoplanes sandaracinus TaxID=3045177 RepID=A0ABT6WSF7_9ACTN|nr:patatin-like phospholipase family protein [Actinoplanes sandaracinus]MDI6102669.1 patatin-like phospholipase family protein [Actinoplanes sandaracinus]